MSRPETIPSGTWRKWTATGVAGPPAGSSQPCHRLQTLEPVEQAADSDRAAPEGPRLAEEFRKPDVRRRGHDPAIEALEGEAGLQPRIPIGGAEEGGIANTGERCERRPQEGLVNGLGRHVSRKDDDGIIAGGRPDDCHDPGVDLGLRGRARRRIEERPREQLERDHNHDGRRHDCPEQPAILFRRQVVSRSASVLGLGGSRPRQDGVGEDSGHHEFTRAAASR
jgi:hypothetical protein